MIQPHRGLFNWQKVARWCKHNLQRQWDCVSYNHDFKGLLHTTGPIQSLSPGDISNISNNPQTNNSGHPIVAILVLIPSVFQGMLTSTSNHLVQSLPSYVNDAYHFHEILIFPNPFFPDSLMVTVDVTSLYINILIHMASQPIKSLYPNILLTCILLLNSSCPSPHFLPIITSLLTPITKCRLSAQPQELEQLLW